MAAAAQGILRREELWCHWRIAGAIFRPSCQTDDAQSKVMMAEFVRSLAGRGETVIFLPRHGSYGDVDLTRRRGQGAASSAGCWSLKRRRASSSECWRVRRGRGGVPAGRVVLQTPCLRAVCQQSSEGVGHHLRPTESQEGREEVPLLYGEERHLRELYVGMGGG